MLISKSREKKRLGQKEQKRFCKELNPSLGCTTCKYGPSTVIYGQKFQIRYRIYGVPRKRRIYGHTVWANPTHITLGDLICFYGFLRHEIEGQHYFYFVYFVNNPPSSHGAIKIAHQLHNNRSYTIAQTCHATCTGPHSHKQMSTFLWQFKSNSS